MLKKRRRKRRIICIICIGLIIASIVLIFGNRKSTITEEKRYVQSEVALPEEISWIWDMQQVLGSELFIAAQEQEGDRHTSALWLLDENMSWERKYNINEKIGLSKELEVSCMVTISSQGEMICTVIYPSSGNMEVSAVEYYLIDTKEEVRKLDIELPNLHQEEHAHEQGEAEFPFENNMMQAFQITPEGDLLGLDLDGKIHRINKETGEIEKTIPRGSISHGESVDSQIEQFVSIGETVLTVGAGGVRSYQMEEEGIVKTKEEIDRVVVGETWFGNEDDRELLILSEKGLYEYIDGVGVPKLLIEKQKMLLSEIGNIIPAIIKMEDDRILLAVNNVGGGNSKILQYEERVFHSSERVNLELYALERSKRLEESITRFQAVNPNIEIKLRTGRVNENGITREDAIKQLNMEMLAGDGPDILLMDGLDIETYSSRDLLISTAEIVNQSIVESGVFENIITAFQKDNDIYVVPTRMEIPIIQANDMILQDYQGIDTLLQWLTDVKTGEEIIANRNFEQLVTMLSQVKPLFWQKDATELTKERFFDFFDLLYQLYIEGDFKEGADVEDNGDFFVRLNYGTGTFAASTISEWANVEYLYNTKRNFTKRNFAQQNLVDMSFTFLEESQGKVFIPRGVIGISANSEHSTEAKEFLGFLLSREEQSKVPNFSDFSDDMVGGEGLSITEEGLNASLSRKSEIDLQPMFGGYQLGVTGETWSIEEMTVEEKDDFLQFVLDLDTAGATDPPFSDILEEQVIACAKGQISTEEAKEQLWQRIQLYNAE